MRSTDMDRYGVALLLFALAVVPLAYVNIWLSVAAGLVVYGLLARLADNDLHRRFHRRRSLRRRLSPGKPEQY